MRAIALILLLLATPSQAATIILIGDSLAAGATWTALGGNVSPHRPAVTIRELVKKLPIASTWRDATVIDWTIGGTYPIDWSFKPAKATECVGVNNPWDCCTGLGVGTNCICDMPSGALLYSPHLRSACTTRTPILNHITQGADLALIHTDGIVVTTTADAVDDIADLITAVDAMSVTVLASSPTYILCPILSPCTLCDNHSAVRTEMNLRGLITGPDFFTGRPAECGPDAVHARDSDYAGMAATWVTEFP